MRSSSAKNKGRVLQKFTRDLLLSLADHLEPDDVRSVSMGAGGEDVLLSPAARRVFPVSIECKNVERLNVWDAFSQAEANAGEYEPVLVFKKNRKDPKVMVDARFFFSLFTQNSLNSDT